MVMTKRIEKMMNVMTMIMLLMMMTMILLMMVDDDDNNHDDNDNKDDDKDGNDYDNDDKSLYKRLLIPTRLSRVNFSSKSLPIICSASVMLLSRVNWSSLSKASFNSTDKYSFSFSSFSISSAILLLSTVSSYET